MSTVMSTILPVILLLLLGIFCRRSQVLTKEQMDGIKTLSVRFLWPVVLFYAFFTADYGKEVLILAAVNFIAQTALFFTGRYLRSKLGGDHAFSYPYLLSGCEIGMLGYPLYTLLFQGHSIAYLAMLDIGHAFFIFPIFINLLQLEQSEAGSAGQQIRSMLLSPIVISLIIGISAGVSGFSKIIMASGAGDVINSIYNLASSANTVTILLAMGYGISITADQLRKVSRVMAMRFVGMGACAVLAILVSGRFLERNIYMTGAILLMFIMPPVYLLGVYTKDEKENSFMTTMTSIYTVFSILAFMIMAIFLH